MAATNETIQVRLVIPWWMTWVYLPLTQFGVWLGVPVDVDKVADDVVRSVRAVHVKK